MDVVLADGSFVHATPSDSPDIYYAMRGSADSFGITTTFYLQTQPAPARIVSFDSDFASSLKSPDTAADILLKLQTFVTTSTLVDRNLTLEIYINVFGNFSVRGWYFGKQDHFAETLLPAMLDEMSKPANTTVKEMDWLTALKDIAEGEPLIEPPTGYNNHQTFYTKSVVTREAEPLTRAALTSFFEYVAEKGLSASHPWNTYISLYGGRDSQINVPEADSAAYSHRDSLWVFQVSTEVTCFKCFTKSFKEYRVHSRLPSSMVTRDYDFRQWIEHSTYSGTTRRRLPGLSELPRP